MFIRFYVYYFNVEIGDKILEIEESYLSGRDQEVYENANMTVSMGSFIDFMLDKLLKTEDVLSKYLPSEAVRAHVNGDIHIHKLPYSLWIPYCTGWSISRIISVGLKTPAVIAGPPKHFESALSQIVDFLYVAQQEWTGAQAFSAVDLFLAPFIRFDNLSYRRVKQRLQSMLYQLNVPARLGMQTPFTNITLFLDVSRRLLDVKVRVAGKSAGLIGDYIDEALLFSKALFELYLEGDSLGQPFTFPIPTLMVTRDFDWNGRRWGELTDIIFEGLARRGVAYLLNGYATDVEALYAMCCRLTVDISRVKLRLKDELGKVGGTRGIWALPDATGSIGVVTVNLPRIAALSRGEWDVFEDMLRERLELARRVLLTLRKRYMKSLNSGLMPITRIYLSHFWNHYNTFGLIGLPEAAANFMGNPRLWLNGSRREMREAVDIERRMVEAVRRYCIECEEEDGCLYNVEEVPGEYTSYRLALLDTKLFKRRDEMDRVAIPTDGVAPFYSNSVVPYYADVPVYLRAEWEGLVQQEFTGGVMMHIFLSEAPDTRALRNLIRRICENTKVVYFSITPSISVCRRCGWNTVGVVWKCPRCSSDTSVWSRIVGYYRPVGNWNIGRRAEFKLRKTYKLRNLQEN